MYQDASDFMNWFPCIKSKVFWILIPLSPLSQQLPTNLLHSELHPKKHGTQWSCSHPEYARGIAFMYLFSIRLVRAEWIATRRWSLTNFVAHETCQKPSLIWNPALKVQFWSCSSALGNLVFSTCEPRPGKKKLLYTYDFSISVSICCWKYDPSMTFIFFNLQMPMIF